MIINNGGKPRTKRNFHAEKKILVIQEAMQEKNTPLAPDSIRILLIERIFHEKQKIKVLAKGDRTKLIERYFHAQEKR